MKNPLRPLAIIILIIGSLSCPYITGQPVGNPLKTPLPQGILDDLTNEISGQVIYNNMVLVTGAPWLRDDSEFSSSFYETVTMFNLVKSYGINNVKIERYDREGMFDYPVEAELWVKEPSQRLIARLDADPALVARGSESVDLEGELVYIPPLDEEKISSLISGNDDMDLNGKIALMWSHPRGATAQALDAAGVKAVVSFNSRERYIDPDMVVYGSGSYKGNENLRAGFTLSWKQWSELLEDFEHGEKISVKCHTKIDRKPDRFEAVLSWIPGKEPDKKGVLFTAHLFEGYTKRGANDNTGGCVVQLEILRALTKLIESGKIEQPMRNIYFLWPNEISGTYEFIKNNHELVSNTAININMDMVTEGLRLNNSVLTFGETPNHLPSFYDGLVKTILNYVWRTNDIVYLPNSPRGRRGGQYFPKPMTEKNGSNDAFRFYMHSATGGSDHICFNNPAVAVPGIEFFTWPDYWYHADKDTPDKGDPTQMKRIAFIGAATAYASANCSDKLLPEMLNAVSSYALERVSEREFKDAMTAIHNSGKDELDMTFQSAIDLIDLASDREEGAIESLYEICSGSDGADKQIATRLKEWSVYAEGLRNTLSRSAAIRAEQLTAEKPEIKKLSSIEARCDKIIPAFSDEVKYSVFSLNSWPAFIEKAAKNPDNPSIRLARSRSSRAILNYINGERSVYIINSRVSSESGIPLNLEDTMKLFEMLEDVGYIEFK